MRKKPSFKILIEEEEEGRTTDETVSTEGGFSIEAILGSLEYEFNLTPEQEKEKKAREFELGLLLCEEILRADEGQYEEVFKQKIKADILKLVLDNINGKAPEGMSPLVLGQNCGRSLKNIVEDAYLEAKIGEVKYRDFVKIENKTQGVSQGEFVVKAKASHDDFSLKHNYKWIRKTSSNSTKNIGEEICEYVGTNLMNYLLEDNSPKIRLLKDPHGNVSLGVKFLNNFKTFASCNREEINDIEAKIANRELKGLANFYLANMILGDYDNNPGNFGFIADERGEVSIARIDHGKIFSYKTIKKKSDSEMMDRAFAAGVGIEDFEKEKYNYDYDLNNVEAKVFANRFFRNKNMFEGRDFSLEISSIIEKIDIGFMIKIIDRSIQNVKEAYGENIFLDSKVKKTLAERMMLPESMINEESFKIAIIDNINQIGEKIQNKAKDNILSDRTKKPRTSWVESVQRDGEDRIR